MHEKQTDYQNNNRKILQLFQNRWAGAVRVQTLHFRIVCVTVLLNSPVHEKQFCGINAIIQYSNDVVVSHVVTEQAKH